MHDDTNIRSLRGGDGLHLVKTDGDAARGDVERRVAQRQDGETHLELVPDIQSDDLQPTVRELPISAETVAWRGELALLRQEHKDLDDAILALETMPLPDQILIARMKRKKLAVRDRMTTLEDKIRPDIIA
ncbi:hypothetical protein ABI_19010 [Asticcacaulis biprosthecium C19]|uniref:DUF465 domain-containing protein n=1 Tax=Asticcacaulis biprosthecium C19 TaxID=715226 RepID=F4QL86_9CAUL|nr:DUF465 domain-containing protein [Asticcacaulis biprosthecium]EGF93461.1 hypothetical protein ABI_19010 [Asticcacaulis biprosthecium C19]